MLIIILIAVNKGSIRIKIEIPFLLNPENGIVRQHSLSLLMTSRLRPYSKTALFVIPIQFNYVQSLA